MKMDSASRLESIKLQLEKKFPELSSNTIIKASKKCYELLEERDIMDAAFPPLSNIPSLSLQSNDIGFATKDSTYTPVVLVGILTANDKENVLCINDATGSYICEILRPRMEHLKKIICVLEGFIISAVHQESNYPELQSLSSPTPEFYVEAAKVSCVNDIELPASQNLLLDPRSLSVQQGSGTVDVEGKLVAVSPITIVRNVSFFFVRVGSSSQNDEIVTMTIVFKGVPMHAHHFAIVGEQVLLTALKPTVLFKNRAGQRNLFRASSATKLFLLGCGQRMAPNVTQTGLQTHHKAPTPLKVSPPLRKSEKTSTNSNSRMSHTPSWKRFVPVYEGIITKELNASRMTLELDDALTIFCSHSALNRKGRGLREGTRVRVWNTHIVTDCGKKYGKGALGCCFYSAIQIVQFAPPRTTPYQLKDSRRSAFFKYAQVLSLNGFATFLRLFDSLVEKLQGKNVQVNAKYLKVLLQPHVGRYSDTSFMKNVLRLLSIPEMKRNVYDEFCQHENDRCSVSCPYPHWNARTSHYADSTLCIPTMSDVLERKWPNRVGTDFDNLRISSSELPVSGLIGCLVVSSSGSLLLSDRSGSVPVLAKNLQPTHMNAWWGFTDFELVYDNTYVGHDNNEVYGGHGLATKITTKRFADGTIKEAKELNDPWLEYQSLRAANTTNERGTTIDEADEKESYRNKTSVSKESGRLGVYVWLDMKKCNFLHPGKNDGSGISLQSKKKSKPHKDGLGDSQFSMNTSHLTFRSDVVGNGTQQSFLSEDSTPQIPYSTRYEHVYVCVLHKTFHRARYKDDVIGKTIFSCHVVVLCPPQRVKLINTDLDQDCHEAFMDCKRAAIRWYPFLKPFQVYCLSRVLIQDTCVDDVTLSSVILQDDSSLASITLVTDSKEMSLEGALEAPVFNAYQKVARKYEQQHLDRLQSCRDVSVQNRSKDGKLSVSIRGVVTATDLVSSTSASMSSMLGSDTLRVTLKDLDGPDGVSVYIGCDTIVPPVGLTVGEVVTFTRLKATVSANEKSIYFCAMTNSGLILEGPHEKIKDNIVRESVKQESSGCKLTNLESLLGTDRLDRRIHQVLCRTVVVRKARVWLFCTNCHTPVEGRLCRSACQSSWHHLLTACEAIIDDGTAQAYVFVNNTDVFASLIGASQQRMADLERACRRCGEIVLYSSPNNEDLYGNRFSDSILFDMVHHPRIHRQIILTGKRVFNKKAGGDNIQETAITLKTQRYKTLTQKTLAIEVTAVQESGYLSRAKHFIQELFKVPSNP
eukprot:m.152373 g.152373  ORF g.152373 m.152373 type:complete len:1263 (-) comp15053_c0_seq4:41-3829(-)